MIMSCKMSSNKKLIQVLASDARYRLRTGGRGDDDACKASEAESGLTWKTRDYACLETDTRLSFWWWRVRERLRETERENERETERNWLVWFRRRKNIVCKRFYHKSDVSWGAKGTRNSLERKPNSRDRFMDQVSSHQRMGWWTWRWFELSVMTREKTSWLRILSRFSLCSLSVLTEQESLCASSTKFAWFPWSNTFSFPREKYFQSDSQSMLL